MGFLTFLFLLCPSCVNNIFSCSFFPGLLLCEAMEQTVFPGYLLSYNPAELSPIHTFKLTSDHQIVSPAPSLLTPIFPLCSMPLSPPI